jgi:adenylate cyclase
MADRDTNNEWERILHGNNRGANFLRGIFGRIPSTPRCKLCAAPFGLPGRPLVKLVGAGQSPLNRRLCKLCMRQLHKEPGGAEVEITVLFADVRGSTGLAERLGPAEYSQLIARFYGVAARAVDDHDGLVDKFVGDEAVALFIPGFTGTEHAAAALGAARELLDRTVGDDGAPWLELGIGVHTGVSYVGTVGEGDAIDFTALGDTVNVAARLRDEACAGETIISDETARAAGLETAGLERRTLTLRGRDQPLDAWVVAVRERATAAA